MGEVRFIYPNLSEIGIPLVIWLVSVLIMIVIIIGFAIFELRKKGGK